eukprot:6176406-Pleurochrysis_carterae.AAC.1
MVARGRGAHKSAAAIASENPRAWGAERERSASARDDSLQVNVGRARGSNCSFLGLEGKTLCVGLDRGIARISRYDRLR